MDIVFASPFAWFIASLVLMGLELVLPGVFLIWIGIGAAIVGLCLTVLPELSLALQLVILALAMLASVYLGVIVQRRRTSDPASGLNAGLHYYIGRQAEVDTDFSAGHGRVRIDDTWYTASSKRQLRAGERVTVTDVIDGILQVD